MDALGDRHGHGVRAEAVGIAVAAAREEEGEMCTKQGEDGRCLSYRVSTSTGKVSASPNGFIL